MHEAKWVPWSQRPENRERFLASRRAHNKEYEPQYRHVRAAKSNIRKLYPHNVPKWLTDAQWEEIYGFYRLSQELTRSTGILHVVDHIWPLNGINCCGLHVPWNLQIITGAENVLKGSQDPDHG